MKATLEFQLPEEREEFSAACQGSEARSLLWHIDQHLRGIVKHGNPTDPERRLAEAVRDMIRESTITLE
jgi:hypothetical protein